LTEKQQQQLLFSYFRMNVWMIS